MLRDGSRNNDDKYILTQNKEKLSKLTDCDLWSAEFLIVKSVRTQAREAWQECGNKRCTSESLDERVYDQLVDLWPGGRPWPSEGLCPFGFYNF